MKKSIKFFAAFGILILLLSLTDSPPIEKKYEVSFTVGEWQTKLNIIEYSKEVLKKSSAPANVVLPLIDSLTKFQTDLVAQLKPQLDTTKKK